MSAAVLAFGRRQDRRAVSLALCLLLVASLFADRLLLRLATLPSPIDSSLLFLAHVQVAALLPYFLWRFVGEFPRAPVLGRGRWLQHWAVHAALAVGLLLLALNVVRGVAELAGWEAAVLRLAGAFDRFEDSTLYQSTLFAIMLPTLPLLVWKAHKAVTGERRRVWLLLAGIVAGSAPMLIVVLLMSFWPAVDEAFSDPRVFRWLEIVVYTGSLSIPVATAYAVLVQQALDVRLVIRRAVRYALARYTVVLATVTPFVVLATLLVIYREQSLTQLVAGTTGAWLGAAGLLGATILLTRNRILNVIDRHFFREQYDANQILHSLVEGSRNVPTARALENLLIGEIDRALHLQSGALLVRLPASSHFASPSERCRPLEFSSAVTKQLMVTGAELPVDFSRHDPAVDTFPLSDRQWLGDGGFSLLMPLISSTGDVLGILALGSKRSELPFSQEDRRLLKTLTASAAVTLEDRILSTAVVTRTDEGDRSAAECPVCGRLGAAEARVCTACHGQMQPAHVPLTLAGKFRLEERIGEGGMGVVYRAEDLNLGRRVAIKTLPWVTPFFAERLRHEARAMALVSHPNLATIHGVEFFHGTPMLVVEYLAGGTLADRLHESALPLQDALGLGIILAGVADRIHRAGILHRDIKPSNVGYTSDGIPKLLDFGLARTIEVAQEMDASAAQRPDRRELPPSTEEQATKGQTLTDAIVGTAAYLAPEAINGELPDIAFDLWSICVVIYEAIAGTNPFRGPTMAVIAHNVLAARVPDLREQVPDCPESVTAFFRDALHENPKKRPPSARVLQHRFQALRVPAPSQRR